MTPAPDFAPLVALLERQREAGAHLGAQLYVSLRGEPLLDVAVGESVAGRPLRGDDLMLWYSSSKPVTTVAVLQLWEQDRLGLDDPVARFIPDWGAGKERITLRHVLTHTGGFTMVGAREPFDDNITYAEAIARISAHPVEWEPGAKAGYHPTTGWKVLGAVVEAVDGRPIDRYVADEVLGRAGLATARLGVSEKDQVELGDRLSPVHWTGHAFAIPTDDGGIRMQEYRMDRIHNEPWHIAKVEPGGGIRGPASELGRFYEALLGYGPALLDPRTVEVMIAVHRQGIPDVVFGNQKTPWGLGVQVADSLTGGVGRRAFGHNGMASSRGFADPDAGLAVAFVTNGLPNPLRNEQRMYEVADAIYNALGDEVAHLRVKTKPLPEVFKLM